MKQISFWEEHCHIIKEILVAWKEKKGLYKKKSKKYFVNLYDCVSE
jgi:hypothetical protein